MDSGRKSNQPEESIDERDLESANEGLLANHADARDELWESVYAELRRRARALLAHERPNHTLRPTEVVHEVWMRFSQSKSARFGSRPEFFAFAGGVMRHVLVDHARARGALRRGGKLPKVDFREAFLFSDDKLEQVLQVDQLVTRLAEWNSRLASVVELRFFAGLTEDETAEALNLGVRTVKRDWQMAKAWILAELDSAQPPV
jgi:RNA polymerase sigma factor (TIGR02999 family)